MYCQKCGTQLAQEASFCSSCGTKLSGPQAQSYSFVRNPNEYNMNVEQKNDATPFIIANSILAFIGIFFLGIVCYGIGFFLTYKMKSAGAKTAFIVFLIINIIGMVLSLIGFALVLLQYQLF